jgi:hypothetical protein
MLGRERRREAESMSGLELGSAGIMRPCGVMPLYLKRRTWRDANKMSALCQHQTPAAQQIKFIIRSPRQLGR